jgi:hypothetical protein
MTSVFCFQMIVTSAPLYRRNQDPASLNACPVDQLRLSAPPSHGVHTSQSSFPEACDWGCHGLAR